MIQECCVPRQRRPFIRCRISIRSVVSWSEYANVRRMVASGRGVDVIMALMRDSRPLAWNSASAICCSTVNMIGFYPLTAQTICVSILVSTSQWGSEPVTFQPP